jgi:hypothetical protein
MVDNNKLPPRARAKIFALADQEASALTVLTANQRQIAEIAKAHDIASDDKTKMEYRDESNRRQAVQETHRERHHALADLNGRIRRFLDTLPAQTVLEAVKPIKIKLKPGETHSQLVHELRVTIVQLIGERSQVERAGLPTDEIRAQVKAWITRRSIEARPAITASHDKFAVNFTYMDPESFTPALDPLALMAWLDPELLEDKLNELVDMMPKPKFVMTPQEKSKRLKEIRAELDEAERYEVALIDDAQDNGVMIEHRPNVDIPALLAVAVMKKGQKAA